MNRTRFHVLTLFVCAALVASVAPVAALSVPRDPATDSQDLIVFFKPDTGVARILETLVASGIEAADIDVRRDDMAVVRVDSGAQAQSVSVAMQAGDLVNAVSLDRRVQALGGVPPADPAYDGVPYPQRAYLGPASVAPHSLHMEPVWDRVFNGDSFALTPDRSGVRVAIVDTGASLSLLEDSGDFRGVWDYVNDDDDPADDAAGIGFHGTRIASLIHAETDNAAGIAGVVHDLELRVLIYKCLDVTGGGSSADCMQAMRDAADDGAQVINASFGERATTTYLGTTPDLAARAVWQDTVDYCVDRGAVVVAASGNDANKTPAYTPVFYPAACTGALAVGSIDASTGLRSSYSCFGPELDVVAPGRFKASPTVGVWTVLPSGSADQNASGTSFSTPLVSGSLAFLWSLVPDLPASSMVGFLLDTADDSYGPTPGPDLETGHGLVDVEAAYGEMTRTVGVQAPVSLTAEAPNGVETRLSWSTASGSGVSYLYGYLGGPAYATTATSGRLVVPGDGTHTVWVRSFARDRWGAQNIATTTVTVAAGLAPIRSDRHAGRDRYETAVAISDASFEQTSAAAVVALGTNWPDALACSTLARGVDGPLLLTRASSLPLPTRDELRSLQPKVVYIAGGTSAISEDVENTIRAILPLDTSIVRLGGTDRYDTARIIARYVTALPGFDGSTAIIASGQNYPDALCAAPVATAAGWPILLTRTDSLPVATQRALAQIGTTASVIVGGERAVNASVERQLPSAARWAGTDRYATSRVVADEARVLGLLDSRAIGFATGRAFPDALSAGPLSGGEAAPVVLVDRVGGALWDWLQPRTDATDSVVLYGGTSALPYDVEFDLLGALRHP